ncbi:MAG: M15 family metallopeptidase [Clostridia bacterium]|nr:M15 family metallopeptidase [Clostridia bacterium]
MGNRATPPRSFNTLKHSNRDQRIKRRKQERVVLLSIFTVVIAILLTLAIFLVCSLVDVIKANNPPKDKENGTETGGENNPTQEISYQSTTQANTAVYTGELVVVNASHEYHFPTTTTGLKNIYDNRVKYQDISNTYMVGNTGWKLQSAALDAFNSMMLKYFELFEDGSIKISSAYRSYEDQASSTTSSTPAGYSDHHTGLCIALRPNDGTYLEDDHWIYQNCHKYGFIIRYPDSKSAITGVSGYEYCIRYVGVAHATYMNQNNLCMEEYVELLKNTYTSSNHLKITGTDGNNYEVYYVPAGSGEVTTLQVPKNRTYTISGDNIGGFIITVNLDQPTNE